MIYPILHPFRYLKEEVDKSLQSLEEFLDSNRIPDAPGFTQRDVENFMRRGDIRLVKS